MNYIALNETQLLRFSHHWFWGLCFDYKKSHSLLDAALTLNRNADLREKLEKSVDGFNQRSWLTRSLFWLLNYHQYRLHYYQLQGYWSLQLYQKGITMFSESNRSSFLAAGGFFVAAASLFAIKIVPQKMSSSLNWFSSKISPLISKQNFTQLPETDVAIEPEFDETSLQLMRLDADEGVAQTISTNPLPLPYFVVESTMLRALTTLGITAQVNEQITLATLKVAYDQSRLQTHPDKSGVDNHSAFIAVTEAYDALITLIQEQNSQNGLQFNSSLFDELEKMKQGIRVLNQGIAELRESNLKMSESLNCLDRKIITLRKNLELYEQNKKEVEEHIKRQQEHEKRQQEREKRQQEREKEQQELDIAQKKIIKNQIIRLNKEFNFPELTEKTLQAYCSDPQSFIRKIREQEQIEKNKMVMVEEQPQGVPDETSSAALNKTVVFFKKPSQKPEALKGKVKTSFTCFK